MFDDFLQRGLPVQDAAQSVFAQGPHALADRLPANERCRRLLQHKFADWLGHSQPFKEAQTALLAGLVAVITTAPVVKSPRPRRHPVEPGLAQDRRR